MFLCGTHGKTQEWTKWKTFPDMGPCQPEACCRWLRHKASIWLDASVVLQLEEDVAQSRMKWCCEYTGPLMALQPVKDPTNSVQCIGVLRGHTSRVAERREMIVGWGSSGLLLGPDEETSSEVLLTGAACSDLFCFRVRSSAKH